MSGYWALVPRFRYGTQAFGPWEWRWIKTVGMTAASNNGNCGAVFTWTSWPTNA